MKKVFYFFVAFLFSIAVLSLTGCSTMEVVRDKGVQYVNGYCDKPAGEREAIRQMVNEQIAPHELALKCDPRGSE